MQVEHELVVAGCWRSRGGVVVAAAATTLKKRKSEQSCVLCTGGSLLFTEVVAFQTKSRLTSSAVSSTGLCDIVGCFMIKDPWL